MKDKRKAFIVLQVLLILVIVGLSVYLSIYFSLAKNEYRLAEAYQLQNEEVMGAGYSRLLLNNVFSDLWEYLTTIFKTTLSGLKTTWHGLRTFFGVAKVAIHPLYSILKALKWFMGLFN